MKPRKIRWRSYLPWLGIVAMGLVQLWALPGDYLGYEQDDVFYVLMAHSLLHGQYRLWISPGNPPYSFLPPGWPILLMPAAALSGDNPAGYHLTAWLSLVACDVLVWFWIRKRLKPAQAYWVVALFALNPLVLARAGKVMTEIPTLALALGLCVALDSESWPGWALGAVMGFFWLVRQRAVAFFAAVWAWFAIKRRWKDLAASAVVASVAVLGWSWWQMRVRSNMPEWSEFADVYGNWNDMLPTIAANLVGYLRLLGRIWLPYFPAPNSVEAATGVIFCTFCLIGIVRIIRGRGPDPAIGWLILGGLMHLIWPWQYERYLVPFLPMLLWGFFEGLNALPRLKDRWVHIGLSVVLLGQFMGQSRYVLSGQFARAAPELKETYAWIRRNIPAQEALSSPFFARDAFYTGHPFATLPKVDSAKSFVQALKRERVQYVLMQDGLDVGLSLGQKAAPARALLSLQEMLRKSPFKMVYHNQNEKSAIYAF